MSQKQTHGTPKEPAKPIAPSTSVCPMPPAPCPSAWEAAQTELNAYVQQQANVVAPEIEVESKAGCESALSTGFGLARSTCETSGAPEKTRNALRQSPKMGYLRLSAAKSLTLGNFIDPSSWKLTTEEVAEALSIQIERVVSFTQLPHCISVVWLNDKGQKCSCFHSYRLFTRWQKAAQSLVTSCDTQEQMERIASAIQRDLCRYKYRRPEVANGIWNAVLRQQKVLNQGSSKGWCQSWSKKAVQLSLF